jgi:hypothetical protein
MPVYIIKRISKYYTDKFDIPAIVEYEEDARLIVEVANTSGSMEYTYEYERMEVR